MKTPLFYRQVVVVDKNIHGDVSIAPITDMNFAAGVNSVILLAAEFVKACREYPIVFIADQGSYSPAAVLGLRKGQNSFITKDGAWEASYIPAYIRRYPFIPAMQTGGKEYLVCIDELFGGVNREGRGERLFSDDGNVTKVFEQYVSFLKEFHVQHKLTVDFCAEMLALGLMEPMQADVAMSTGEKLKLDGFYVLNRKKMAGLPDETISKLHRQGYLELVYAHLVSLENFDRLVKQDREKII
jgi:hypothetical protein